MGKDKYFFCRKIISFLGYLITPQGIKPNEALIEKIQNYPTLVNVTTIRQFLGLTGYYRQFIQDYARTSEPLIRLTRKKVLFEWTHMCQEAFTLLKNKLTSYPILQFPDFEQQFILSIDASDTGIGAALEQRDKNGRTTTIGYASRALQPAERNYHTTEKECLALVWAVSYFHKFLYGRSFKIVTDHQALKVLNGPNSTKGRLARWKIILQPYIYEVEYRKGTQHILADALSRLYQDQSPE